MSDKKHYLDGRDLWAVARATWSDDRADFEKDFAHYIGSKYAIGTSYGRTALRLGLQSVGVCGREVVVPAFICTVVRNAIVEAGGVPRFMEVAPDTLCLDVDALRRGINQQTSAIILVHYYGYVARNLDEILDLAKTKGIPVIEDCAHSLGAEVNNRKAGTYGDIGVFSLTKGMVNFGGGVLVTDEPQIYEQARERINHESIGRMRRIADMPQTIEYGLEQTIAKVVFDRMGNRLFKWWLIKLPRLLLVARRALLISLGRVRRLIQRKRPVESEATTAPPHPAPSRQPQRQMLTTLMDPLSAALGRTQLAKVESFVQRRRQVLDVLGRLEWTQMPSPAASIKDAFTFCVLRVPEGRLPAVMKHCRNLGISLTATWPTHQRLWDNQDKDCVKQLAETILTWHINPSLTDSEISKFLKIIEDSTERVNTPNRK